MSCYGKVAYWNERYSFKKEQYDWFLPYDGFRHLMTAEMLSPASGVSTSKPRKTIVVRGPDGRMVERSIVCPDDSPRLLSPTKFPLRATCRVLIVGCGNASLGEAMLKDGWTGGICNVDYSPVVIEQMKERYDDAFYKQLKESHKSVMGGGQSVVQINPMEFVCADVTTGLPFDDGSFDLVVCKGTLDAILSSDGSIADAKRMMHECCRVLSDIHGAFVVVTHASPENRLVFFENPYDEWWAGLNVHKLPKGRSALNDMASPDGGGDKYVYTCRKQPGGGEATRPVDCATNAMKTLNRSSSNEENDETVATDMSSPKKHLKKKLSPAPPRDKKESRALMQVPVVMNC